MIFSEGHITFFSLLIGLLLMSCQEKTSTLDLAGNWNFKIDSLEVGEEQEWFKQQLEDTIQLPGSMAENRKGNDISLETGWTGNMWNDSLWYKSPKYAEYRQPGNIKVSFWLSPEKVYYGPAWYQKEVKIPKDWNEKNIFLNLERAHWETTVWVDDQKVDSQNSLATPHKYNLVNYLSTGKHTITIRVDNRIKDINVGKDAHSVTDNTQSNWNGMVGDIQLVTRPKVYLDLVRVYPNVKKNEVNVVAQIKNTSGAPKEVEFSLSAELNVDNASSIPSIKQKFTIEEDQEITMTYPMGENVELWDEFNPNVYGMECQFNI